MKKKTKAYLFFFIGLFAMCACGNRDEISEEQSSIIISEKISRDDKEGKIASSISLSISDNTQGMLLSLEQMQDIISRNEHTTIYAIKDANDITGETIFEIISVNSPKYKVPQVTEMMTTEYINDNWEVEKFQTVMTTSKICWLSRSQELVMFSSFESVPSIMVGEDCSLALPLYFYPRREDDTYSVSVPEGLENTIIEGGDGFSFPLKINGVDFDKSDLKPFSRSSSYLFYPYEPYDDDIVELGTSIVEAYRGTTKQKTVLQNVMIVWFDYNHENIDFSQYLTYQDGYVSLGNAEQIWEINNHSTCPNGILAGNAFLMLDLMNWRQYAEEQYVSNQTQILENQQSENLLVIEDSEGNTLMTNGVKNAEVCEGYNINNELVYSVEITLNKEAAYTFKKITEDYYGDSIYINLNGYTISNPRVMSIISDGKFLIPASSEETARELASAIRDCD